MNFIIIGYLFAINVITFFVFGIDKWKAKKNHWRVSEKTLVTLMLIGGGFGGILGMNKFRHKTQKIKFKIAIIIFVIEIAVLTLFVIK